MFILRNMASKRANYAYKSLPQHCGRLIVAVLESADRPLTARQVAQSVFSRPPDPPEWWQVSAILDSMSVHGDTAEIVKGGIRAPRRFQGVQVVIVSVWLRDCSGYLTLPHFMEAFAAGLVRDRTIENKLIEYTKEDGGWWSL